MVGVHRRSEGVAHAHKISKIVSHMEISDPIVYWSHVHHSCWSNGEGDGDNFPFLIFITIYIIQNIE